MLAVITLLIFYFQELFGLLLIPRPLDSSLCACVYLSIYLSRVYLLICFENKHSFNSTRLNSKPLNKFKHGMFRHLAIIQGYPKKDLPSNTTVEFYSSCILVPFFIIFYFNMISTHLFTTQMFL